MIINTYIPELAFSSEFPSISLSEVKDEVYFMLLHKQANGTYKDVLEESFTPDKDMKIFIPDLHSVIDDCLIDTPVNDFLFTFMVNKDSVSYPSRIIRSRAELEIGARSFVANHFLTLLNGTKIIRPDSLEYVSVYALQEESYTISATYRDSSGWYYNKEIAGNVVLPDRVSLIDVSPVNFADEGGVLVSYTVRCGDRKQLYKIDRLSLPSPLSVLFNNNFGVIETFSIGGLLKWEPKFTNSMGSIRGEYKNYTLKYHREYTANTGIMSQHIAEWLEWELFTSLEVFTIKNSMLHKKITITDQKVERSSDSSELPAFEFTYRLSQSIQDVVDFSDKLKRIFDKSFDYTFN